MISFCRVTRAAAEVASVHIRPIFAESGGNMPSISGRADIIIGFAHDVRHTAGRGSRLYRGTRPFGRREITTLRRRKTGR